LEEGASDVTTGPLARDEREDKTKTADLARNRASRTSSKSLMAKEIWKTP